jgi:2-oxoglutarate dehydrogenase E2 component (dihydrolipoamide succinyltransferase)
MLEIKIPSPGESVTEALLARWFVNDGDFVEKNQELAEIESDKATLAISASESGKIKLMIKAGETVKIGSVACLIDNSVTGPSSDAKKKDEKDAASMAVSSKTQDVKSEKQASLSNQQQAGDNAVFATKEVKQETKMEKSPTATSDNHPESAKVTPVAQKIMDEEGLNLDDIINGLKRIGKKEVEAVIDFRKNHTFNSQESPSGNTLDRTEGRKKMTPLRKKLSERLVAVKNQTAMLTTFNEVNMSAIIALRKKYQQQFEMKHGIKVGFMSFFVKAVTQALKLHPNVNSMIDGEEIITPNYYDIAVAVQTDKGLMVPVIRNAEALKLSDIEHNIAKLAEKARSGRISMDEMTGGTFTITNGGVFGSLLSTPIINPPQSAILGMHNIVERPIAVNGKVEIAPMMYIALSYDHRIIDGKDSVSFLVHVKQFIEEPVKLLLNGAEPDKLLLDI